MAHRPTVDRCRCDHRQLHAGGLERCELRGGPVRIAQREVGDGMQPTTRVRDDRRAPSVPRRHVRGERRQRRRQPPLPQQAEVREAHRLVEPDLVEPLHARAWTPIRIRERVVVDVRRAAAAAQVATVIAVALDVSGQVHVGQLDPATAPRHPREAVLVIDELERVVALRRVDVLCPHPPWLVQVLIAVDDARHARKSLPLSD